MSHIPSIDYFNNGIWSTQVCDKSCSEDPSTTASETFVVSPLSKLYSSVRLIHSEFEVMGYSKVLKVENGEIQIIMNNFVDNVLKLITSYRKSISSREEIELSFHRAQSELIHVQKLYRRCQQNLEETQKSNELTKESAKQTLSDKKLLNDRLKSTCNDLRKTQLNFQRHEVQFLHERRKLEKEATDLRKRLASLIDKTSLSCHKGQKTNRPVSTSTDLSVSQSSLLTEGDRKSVSRQNVMLKSSVLTNKESSNSQRFGSSFRTNSGLGSAKSESLSQVDNLNLHINDDLDVRTPKVDLSSLIVQQLESRQNDLLYENRELRDLVGQLSSRMIRFTDFLQRHCTAWVDNNVINASNEFDSEYFSLDEEDDDEYFRRESSDEEYSTIVSVSKGNGRRKSTLVNCLLFELPYAVIRDDLTRRVRYLSRCLWCKLKCLAKHYIITKYDETDGIKSETYILDLPTSPRGDNEKLYDDKNNNEVNLLKNELVEVKSSLANCKSVLKEKELIIERILLTSHNLNKFGKLNLSNSNPELGCKNKTQSDRHYISLLLKKSSVQISEENQQNNISNSSDNPLYSPAYIICRAKQ
ncbi:hypothetical protein EWB00_004240 [Schistosoma japonicum]|uniref:Uncharacterized protein n=1 Tax=Schistosoma japonicum TaxID=6182 RepID=A0A4Z2D5E5_SCHJA|nr:hypothetical protein KSF78_0002544 [Schistosoma japonicum]KAH8863008.1 hypothetical protein KSF78_0002544 [Schistosoma japonicum]TNN11707.1 hypothetical protein EWB00_004240 [Schistosoma japonicum]